MSNSEFKVIIVIISTVCNILCTKRRLCFYSVSPPACWPDNLGNQRVESVPVRCWGGETGGGGGLGRHSNMGSPASTARTSANSGVCCGSGGLPGAEIQERSPPDRDWDPASLHVLQRNWRFFSLAEPQHLLLIASLQVRETYPDTMASRMTCLIC